MIINNYLTNIYRVNKVKIMKKILLIFAGFTFFLFILSTTVVISFSQSWIKIETPKPYINGITFDRSNPDKFILASDSIPVDYNESPIQFYPIPGFGLEYTVDGGQTYSERKLDGYIVLDVVQSSFEEDTYYASLVNVSGRGSVAVTKDGGDTWSIDQKGCEGIYKIFRFAVDNESGRIYSATINSDYGIKYSDDEFVTCNAFKNLSISARDIKVSPLNSNWLFCASDDIFSGQVWRSFDKGISWMSDENGLSRLRIHSVQPSGLIENLVVCGADSVKKDGSTRGIGIYMSIDTGKTFQLMTAIDAHVYDIQIHPSDPNYMAAACGKQGVFVSGNGGIWWEVFNDGLPDEFDVRRVSFPPINSNNDGVVVYAGLYNDGLFKSTRILTSIDKYPVMKDRGLDVVNIFPMPASEYTNVQWRCGKSGIYTVDLYDIRGELISNISNQFYNSGEFTSVINLSGLNSGLYILKISSTESSINCKISVIN